MNRDSIHLHNDMSCSKKKHQTLIFCLYKIIMCKQNPHGWLRPSWACAKIFHVWRLSPLPKATHWVQLGRLCWVIYFLFESRWPNTLNKDTIKFCQKPGDTQAWSIKTIQKVFGEDAMGKTQIKEWYNWLEDGGTSVDSEPCCRGTLTRGMTKWLQWFKE